MAPAISHHYVPQWYQRKFLPAEGGEFFVLDKTPATSVQCADGRVRPIGARTILRRGTHKLFQRAGLYSVALRGVPEDAIERFLFGKIDNDGARASALFCSWPRSMGFGPPRGEFPDGYGNPGHRMMDLLTFMNAQKVRTPKGIDQIRHSLARAGKIAAGNNAVMAYLMARRQLNCTVWAEGVWEIFSAKESKTKFLLADDPVTQYNCDCYPASDPCRYPWDPNAFWRGTRVIYPLSADQLLVISHVEHVDDPSRQKARRDRRNARSYDEAVVSYADIINERKVATVNWILKTRAVKYVASVTEDDLYPEKIVGNPRWCDIDSIFYPKYPSFRTKSEIMVKYNDGSILHTNAFGERDIVPGWFVRQQEAKQKAEEAAKDSTKPADATD
jgi:hypothetical protein